MITEEIKKLVSRPNYFKVGFEYKDVYGNIYVSCTIRDEFYFGKNPLRVRSLATNENEALEKAIKLLNKLKNIDTFYYPPLDKQRNEGGYYRIVVHNDTELEFKRIRDEFIVTNITKKVGDFYEVEEPYEVPEHYVLLGDLEDGNQLYAWDEIGPLCGSAGKAIAHDGKIILKKAEFRA